MTIGYFSETAKGMYGSTFWRRPDGSEIELTYVDSGWIRKPYGFEDAICKGEVKEFCKTGTPPRAAHAERILSFLGYPIEAVN